MSALFWLEHAAREAQSVYADEIAGRTIDWVGKRKSLLKFGRNPDMGSAGTLSTVWDAGVDNETYVSSNAIDAISSSNGSDAIDVTIEGHTVDGSGNFTFVTQTATLNGQTAVALTTPLARCSRIYNAGATLLLGDVYVHENGALTNGVPNDLTTVHCTVLGTDARQQSNKCASTISDGDIFFVTGIDIGVERAAAGAADFSFEVREKGGVFRERLVGDAHSNSGTVELDLHPYAIVPPNADFRMRASNSAINMSSLANVKGILARLV